MAVMGCVQVADAEVTPEQSLELRQLKRDLANISTLLRKQEFDEAQSLLDGAETKVQAIISAAGVPESDRRLLGLPQLIAGRRKALELARNKAEGRPKNAGVSFQSDVVPLIVEHCLECHGPDGPRAGLNLSTFLGWKRGGQSGPLLTPRSALNSRIITRIGSGNVEARMPKGREPLPRESLETIAEWINQGALFDGDNEATSLADLARPRPQVDIPKPKGTETVSFTKDIAPFVVQLCVRCHSGDMPRSGLSLVTFADMLAGGDSGEVILPGKREESRLFRLVGGLENPRMPQGQDLITKQNYDDLVTWFDEGNVFDGNDPYAPLTSYVSTPDQRASQRFAALSPDEWLAHRRDRTEEIWKQSLPTQTHETFASEEFLLIGDVPSERLQQIRHWADEHLASLQRTFDRKSDRPASLVWKGKLAIIVFQERFGFTEYSLSVLDRRSVEGLFGTSVVTPTSADAYIVLEDVGDDPSVSHPGLRALLQEHLTGAYVSRESDLPDWLVRGTGLFLAHRADRANPYFKAISGQAAQALQSLNRPADLLDDGTFSPESVGPVGYLLVQFLIDRTSDAKFAAFIQSLRQGATLADALPALVGSDLATFAQAFLATVKGGR